jgi:hypothetical protein
MKFRYLIIGALLILAFMAMPASAFTAQKLVIDVRDNGDADIQFNYQLTWPELITFSMIPQKEQIVRSAVNSKFPSTKMDAIRISTSSTGLTLKNFAKMSTSQKTPATTSYATPAVSFMMAGDLLNNYPLIAKAITPDFSPEETIVTFPGGKQYTYHDASGIPAITCTVN